MRSEDGEVRVQPIMSGQSVMHDAAEEMEGDCYMRGRPANLSEELKTVYSHEDHETPPFAVTWTNLEMITPSKGSQTEKDKSTISPLGGI